MTGSRVCLLVCSIVFFSSFISSTDSASCCLRYVKRRMSCGRLLGYSFQTINTSCDIPAVIFHIPGRFVCADPAASSTRRTMDCLDERKRRDAQIFKEVTRHHVNVNPTAAARWGDE